MFHVPVAFSVRSNYARTDKSSARTVRLSTSHHSTTSECEYHQSSVIYLHIHEILPNIKFRILNICLLVRSQVPLFNGSSYLRFAPLGDSALIWLELKVIFVHFLFTFIIHTISDRRAVKCASLFSPLLCGSMCALGHK